MRAVGESVLESKMFLHGKKNRGCLLESELDVERVVLSVLFAFVCVSMPVKERERKNEGKNRERERERERESNVIFMGCRKCVSVRENEALEVSPT